MSKIGGQDHDDCVPLQPAQEWGGVRKGVYKTPQAGRASRLSAKQDANQISAHPTERPADEPCDGMQLDMRLPVVRSLFFFFCGRESV